MYRCQFHASFGVQKSLDRFNSLTTLATMPKLPLAETLLRYRTGTAAPVPGRRGIIRGLMSLSAGTFLSRALSLFTMFYVARTLGTAAFGLVNFGVAVVAYATILVGPGLLVWGTRAVAREPQRAGHYLLIINTTQLCLAVVAYTLLLLVGHLLFTPEEQRMAAASGIMLFAVAIGAEWVGQGLERFTLVGISQVVTNLLTFSFTLLLVKSAADMFRVPVAVACAQMIAAAALLTMLWRERSLHFASFALAEAREVIRSALPLGTASAAITVLHYVNNIALQLVHGSTALGLFAAAYRLIEVAGLVPLLLMSAFLPLLSRTYAADFHRTRELLAILISAAISAGCLGAVVLSLDAAAVIDLAYGAAYARSVGVLKILGWAVLPNCAAIAYLTGLIAAGEDRVFVYSVLVGMMIAIGGAVLLVPKFGIAGAAASVAMLDVATWLVIVANYRRIFDRLFLREWVMPVSGAFVAAGVLLVGQAFSIPFVIRLVTAVVLYGMIGLPWTALRELRQAESLRYYGSGSGVR